MTRQPAETGGDAELLQGTLDMLILRVASLGPTHGYAIVGRLQQLSQEALKIRQGSLYPALYRLEDRGWLKSCWEVTEGGRKAKFYSLTKKGRRQMDVDKAGWDRLCRAISLVFTAAAE